jgi:malic enzyme
MKKVSKRERFPTFDVLTLQVFPPIQVIRQVSHAVAVAVAKAAEEEGLARVKPQDDWYCYFFELF